MAADDLEKQFPELTGLQVIRCDTGQKDIFRAAKAGAPVALKVIKNQPKERYEREILATEKLKKVVALGSEYVPRIHDYGERQIAGQKRLYLIEDLIDGKPYSEVLAAQPIQPLAEVRRLAGTLLEACADFDSVQLVHRDIKPDNIMIGAGGKIWVIDFGLARHLDMTSITATGAGGWGTLGYAPPEQFRNIKSEIDSRTDLFAIGIVLYESLSGGNPHLRAPNDPLSIIRRMEAEDLPRLTIAGDRSGEFALFLQSMTARFPSRRPRTAKEALAWFSSIKF